MVQEHLPDATTYINTNANPVQSKHVIFLSRVGIIGSSKAKVMVTGGNSGSTGNTATRISTWNQQAYMSMDTIGTPTMMVLQMMHPHMMQPHMMMQQ